MTDAVNVEGIKGAIMDDYPDATWDTPEELSESFGMQEYSIEDLAEIEAEEASIVPTIDDDDATVEALPIKYEVTPLTGTTFVISGPISPFGPAGIRGRVMTREQAHYWVPATYGKPIRWMTIPHQWAAEVIKPTSPGGRYTPPTQPQPKEEPQPC